MTSRDPMSVLLQASRAIFDAQHIEVLPDALLEEARRYMAADSASVWVPAPEGNLCMTHVAGLKIGGDEAALPAAVAAAAHSDGPTRAPVLVDGSAATEHVRAKSSIVYPLALGSRLVGVLTFDRHAEETPYEQADLARASLVASQVMLALDNLRLARQAAVSEKLATVGQLAAGIAHEINTPIQFLGDGLHFLGTALEDLFKLISAYEAMATECRLRIDAPALFTDVNEISDEVDVQGLREDVPSALMRTKEGIARVTSIVQSIRTFGRPDAAAKEATNLVRLIEATLTVARGEYKYIADVETHFEDLPHIVAHPGEIGQVILNLVVNAAHAIADKAKGQPGAERGKITITAKVEEPQVVLTIADTGCGIPTEIREKIFDAFFTTKATGRGSGLGLSIARGIIVDKHGGEISVQSEVGVGTKFFIRLPIEGG